MEALRQRAMPRPSHGRSSSGSAAELAGSGRATASFGRLPTCAGGARRKVAATEPRKSLSSWQLWGAGNAGDAARRRQRTRSISGSLGFTADPRLRIERAANGLLRDAAMLLLYQDVFRSPPAQAFLKVLLGLRRGDDGMKLLESYGEFFKLMAIGRYPSWEDYILDGVLTGEGNPFAEAAANIGNPKSVWAGGVSHCLRAAATSDLDSLQRLSITESTLSGWVAEIVADVRPEWRTAAASNFSSNAVSRSLSISDEGRNAFGFNISEPRADTVGDSRDRIEPTTMNSPEPGRRDGISTDAPSRHSATETSLQEDREKWRKKIGGLWRWSEAVPLLEKYYNEHSVGRFASTQFLQWKGGKMTIDSKWVTRAGSTCDLSIHKANKEVLWDNLNRHAEKRSAHHVLLFGPSGSSKTRLLRSVLREVTTSKNLHIVTLPVADLKSICALLEELARHWQLRFALVIDDLLSGSGEDNFALLKAALDGNAQDWPENVLLCATSAKKMAIKMKDFASGFLDLAQIFGLMLPFEDLDEDKYLLCVRELMENRKLNAEYDSVVHQARAWASRSNARNVRIAAQFVNALE